MVKRWGEQSNVKRNTLGSYSYFSFSSNNLLVFFPMTHKIFDRFSGKYFIQCCLEEFSKIFRMKFKIFLLNLPIFLGVKVQFPPRNFTKIAEIKRKIQGIFRKFWRNSPKTNLEILTRLNVFFEQLVYYLKLEEFNLNPNVT